MTVTSELLSSVIQNVRVAGDLILERPSFTITQKEGHANFVTDIDRAVEAFLIRELTSLLPSSCVIGEEKENLVLSSTPTWIIDPVDGTTNMIHDLHNSAISVALAVDCVPILGVVYQPYTNELFSAVAGKGATLNGHPIHVSETPFDQALVAFGTCPYHPDLAEKSMNDALTFLRCCADIRRSGSAAIDLANLACGRTDIYYEWTLKPWDFAAGMLLVTEAGGHICVPPTESMPNCGVSSAILAACPPCFFPALEILKQS